MKHCLIVDDSAVVRKIAKRIVEGLSVRASEAEDAGQGLHACQREMPDAVIVDESMPGMDGFEFVRTLRKMPGGTRPKILFCTTENDVGLVARAIHAGADEHFMKPFDRAMLAAKLRQIGIA